MATPQVGKQHNSAQDAPYAIPWWFFVGLLIIVIGATIFMDKRILKSVNLAIKQDAIQSIETSKLVLVSSIEQYKKDMRVLEKSSALIDFTNHLTKNKVSPQAYPLDDENSHGVKQTFSSIMQQNKEIEQLRIIVYPEGMELVRMERINNDIIGVNDAALQNKKTRDYFTEATSVNDHNIYISDIDLNRENGEIQYPITPTIRLAIALVKDTKSTNQNALQGVLVANINAQYLLDKLVANADPRFSTYLLNHNKEFLVHPLINKAFSHELGQKFSWSTEFAAQLPSPAVLTTINAKTQGHAKSLYISQNIELNGVVSAASGQKELLVTLVLEIPHSLISSMRNGRRVNTFGFAGLLTLVVFIMLMFFNAFIKRSMMLNRAKSEHEAIVHGSVDAIIGVSNMGFITTWNKASENLFGIPSASALNHEFNELVVFPNINLMAQIEAFEKEPSTTNKHFECIYSNYDGVLNLELSFSAISTSAEGVVGVSIICRDVTLHKRAQSQVNNINQSLEHKVNARTKELELAKNEAEHANVVKSAFISNISHEMRTPLNGILGTLELLAKEPLSETQKTYLQMTETSINSLNMLINDILDLSKIEAGKMRLDKHSFDVVNEFEKTMAPLALKAFGKKLNFIFDSSGVKFRHLKGDKNRINQITNNILSNAVKFTHEGEVSVSLQSYRSKTGITILCAVTDSGVGIDEQYYHRIFGAFNQEDTSVATKFGGSGLGLSICKQLSKLMQGDVTFTSVKGKGSTFYFSVLVEQDIQQPQQENRLQGVHINLACEHIKEAASIYASLKSQGAVVHELVDALCINQDANILLIDGAHANKQALIEAFSKIPKEYARVIELLTPHVFAARTQISGKDQKWHLMKPFTNSSLLDLLSNSAGYNTLASAMPVNIPIASPLIESSTQLINRILIVDDNDINIAVMKGMIGKHAGTCFSASNGKDALALLKRSAKNNALFDLIFLDCNMPIMDGFECVKRIRQGEAGDIYTDIPVIAVTADAMLGDQEKCLEAGMNDYLTKPVVSRLLIDTLAKWSK